MGLEEISDVGDFTVILDCQQFFLDKSQLFLPDFVFHIEIDVGFDGS